MERLPIENAHEPTTVLYCRHVNNNTKNNHKRDVTRFVAVALLSYDFLSTTDCCSRLLLVYISHWKVTLFSFTTAPGRSVSKKMNVCLLLMAMARSFSRKTQKTPSTKLVSCALEATTVLAWSMSVLANSSGIVETVPLANTVA
jgi:hypothetical protein